MLLAAASAPSAAAPSDYRAVVAGWQAHDARLLAIGWRLSRANAPLCSKAHFAIGMMLTDVEMAADPDRTRTALGIAGDIAIEAVAPGSPAQGAGLKPGDEVLAIAGERVATVPDEKAKDGARMGLVQDKIDHSLDRSGRVTLTVSSPSSAPREVIIAGLPVCPGRFELQRGGKTARADTNTMYIAVQLLAELPSDDEAAAMLAHELAHIILGHAAVVKAAPNNYLVIRRNERIADRMAPWLIANAGYDPAAAPRMILTWGGRHDPGITRASTHDGYRSRAELMAGELPLIAAEQARKSGEPVDWRARFPADPGK